MAETTFTQFGPVHDRGVRGGPRRWRFEYLMEADTWRSLLVDAATVADAVTYATSLIAAGEACWKVNGDVETFLASPPGMKLHRRFDGLTEEGSIPRPGFKYPWIYVAQPDGDGVAWSVSSQFTADAKWRGRADSFPAARDAAVTAAQPTGPPE